VPHHDPGESVVDHSGSGRAVGGCVGSRWKIARSVDDSAELQIPDGHLVLADGGVAGARHLGAPAAAGARDYRPRLEAFLAAAAVPDAAGAAPRLSRHFSSLSELLSADPLIIAHHAGKAVARVLSGARWLMIHALKDELSERPVIANADGAAVFLKQLIGFRCDELLIALYLDARRRLIDYEVVAAGRPDSVDFDERRILLQAMARGATGLILAHNHPSIRRSAPQPERFAGDTADRPCRRRARNLPTRSSGGGGRRSQVGDVWGMSLLHKAEKIQDGPDNCVENGHYSHKQ
jgi:hypothetical protein